MGGFFVSTRGLFGASLGCSMQKVFTKYWLAIQVGVLVGVSCFLGGGGEHVWSLSLFWLSVMCVETALVLPFVRRGETLADARLRVVRAVAKDPLTYLGLAVLLFAGAQWLNSGCRLEYLTDADVWQFSAPAASWAPFSVEPEGALARLSVFVGVVVACLCVRHAVSLSGKRALMQVCVVLSGCAAYGMVVNGGCRTGAPAEGPVGAQAFAWGSFFAFWMIVGMGVFADALARRQRGVELLFGVGFLGNLCGMIFFTTAFWTAIYSAWVVVMFFYWMAYLRTRVQRQVQVKLFLLSLLVLVVVSAAVAYVFPGNPVFTKLAGLSDFTRCWQSLSETKSVRSSAALSVWQSHPWVGVGADGFRHFSAAVIGDQDWRFIKVDQACVYNDSIQLLCEYGLLGAGLLFFSVVFLVAPICHRARIAWKYGDPNEDSHRWFLLRVSPIVVCGALAMALCAAQSWFESPFRLSAVLISWTVSCALLPAFLPAKARTVGT